VSSPPDRSLRAAPLAREGAVLARWTGPTPCRFPNRNAVGLTTGIFNPVDALPGSGLYPRRRRCVDGPRPPLAREADVAQVHDRVANRHSGLAGLAVPPPSPPLLGRAGTNQSGRRRISDAAHRSLPNHFPGAEALGSARGVVGCGWDVALSKLDVAIHGRLPWEWSSSLLASEAVVRVLDWLYMSRLLLLLGLMMWPRWTGQNRPVVDGAKPATTEGRPRRDDVTSGPPRRASRCGPSSASSAART
jgi:hypothetical protein